MRRDDSKPGTVLFLIFGPGSVTLLHVPCIYNSVAVGCGDASVPERSSGFIESTPHALFRLLY